MYVCQPVLGLYLFGFDIVYLWICIMFTHWFWWLLNYSFFVVIVHTLAHTHTHDKYWKVCECDNQVIAVCHSSIVEHIIIQSYMYRNHRLYLYLYCYTYIRWIWFQTLLASYRFNCYREHRFSFSIKKRKKHTLSHIEMSKSIKWFALIGISRHIYRWCAVCSYLGA